MAVRGFMVGSTLIHWSQWQRVVKLCNGDRGQANRVFYRAYCSGSDNIMAWIMAGFKMPDRYAMKPCKQEECGGKDAEAWIESTITGRNAAKKGMVQMKTALKMMLRELEAIDG